MRPRNPFGSSPVRPVQEAPEELEADALYEEEPYGRQGESAEEEEDLQLEGMGSLTGVSIRRKNDSNAAKPATQPRATVARPEETAPRNIVEFWSRLKKGRRWPARTDIDAKQIGMHWPNSVLMRVGENGLPWQFEPLTSDVLRGGGQGFHTGEIEFGNSLVMEWILGMGRRTQQAGQPQEDADIFPTDGGDVRYRAMTVPLGEGEDTVTHVLCHVQKM
jgi:hypothetical protein